MLPRIDLVLATLNDAAVDYLVVGGRPKDLDDIRSLQALRDDG